MATTHTHKKKKKKKIKEKSTTTTTANPWQQHTHHHHGQNTHKKSKKNSHQNPPEIKLITTVRHWKSNPKPTQNSHHHREAHNADLTTPHATSTRHATPTP